MDFSVLLRTSLETAMNDLLQAELSAFLGYETYDKVGNNYGNSRNGTIHGNLKPNMDCSVEHSKSS